MKIVENLGALGVYFMIVFHYHAGYVKNRHLIDPYVSRPSLQRYKDNGMTDLETINERQIFTSSTDPNISSRLKRR